MQTIIEDTIHYVKETLAEAEGGHDWWHIQRVWHTARQIAAHEGGHALVIDLGALLHDIADAKFNGGDEEEGPRRAVAFLKSHGVATPVINAVVHIIRHVSFRKGTSADTLELAVVQDADRLNALGAIGIARAFHYGGFKNRPLYNPTVSLPGSAISSTAYGKSTAPTINHFYKKLLLLKDRMNTATGRRLAVERHQFMEQYLEQFFREVGG